MTLYIPSHLTVFTVSTVFAVVFTVETAVITVINFNLLLTDLCAVTRVMFSVFCASYQ